MVRTRSLGIIVGLGLVTACRSNSAASAPLGTEVATPEPSEAEDSAEPTGGSAGAVASTPTDPDESGSSSGGGFEDPPWFRTSLFPDATVIRKARSMPDDNGLFASSILFALPKGVTAEACADHLEREVGTVVPGLSRNQLPDGRWELLGETERYSVAMQCGDTGEGVRAYVGFTWTKGGEGRADETTGPSLAVVRMEGPLNPRPLRSDRRSAP